MDTISTIPKIDSEQFEKLFQQNVQDTLAVVYLTNLTRAQLTIANRLQNIV